MIEKFFPVALIGVFVGLVFGADRAICQEQIKRINPPELGFFAKQIDCFAIPIKSADVVSDEALYKAKQLLSLMLQNVPDIVANLKESGAELHVIGRKQATSDLPEHRSKKGKPFDGDQDIDARTRGVGGLFASCGEENLLGLPEDRYYSRRSPGSICVHEFAHTILGYGLDDNIRNMWQEQFKRSTGRGLWKSAYATTNYDEYFAELSMWYFGGLGDSGSISPAPQHGKEWLRSYDNEAFQLMEKIYTGRLRPERLESFAELNSLSLYSESSLRSLASEVPTKLKFVNKTSEAVDIFWLDFEGRRQRYGSIEPGEIFVQPTYATHPWVLADKKGSALAIFVATSKPASGILRATGIVRSY